MGNFAWQHRKKYVAIARVGSDGHSFAFNEFGGKGKLSNTDSGCKKACIDYQTYSCGCADSLCGSLKPSDGEEHVRRWAVYEVPAKKKRDKKKKNKNKKKKPQD